MTHNSKQDGYVILVGVLIMGAVAVAVANSVLLLGIGSSRTSLTQQQGYQAQSVADACAEIALQELILESDYDGTGETPLTIGVGTCSIEIIDQPCTDCIIQATAEVKGITRKAKITVAVGTGGGGGSFIPGKGVFPISPAALSYTAAGSTGGITVRDNATTPNRPVNKNFVIAAATKPVVRTTDNRVNVGDVVTLSGKAFNAASTSDIVTCNCGVGNYCVAFSFNGGMATNGPNLCSGVPLVCIANFSGYSYTIPAAPYGERNLTGADKGTGATCTGARTSENQVFFVEPKITKTGGSCASSITLSGSGFGAPIGGINRTVKIIWDNADTLTTVGADANGSFSGLSFVVPINATGHKLYAKDNSSPPNYTSSSIDPCS